jgi:hypothetical protein
VSKTGEPMAIDAIRERYYAVRIGRAKSNLPYFAISDSKVPMLFITLNDARAYRKEVLQHCGHKAVFAVRVALVDDK